ncbi:hypothetical protein GX50_06695 [[Emmonsia] crescens]|uniref:Uncharacterized protein n=1 Tax=[Emmonsia] crescens TaxID=73230 RepID=A0A2B7ZC37_9EURO|nr:hypothetical protein GX50_06695 [Emmonsia crescens]
MTPPNASGISNQRLSHPDDKLNGVTWIHWVNRDYRQIATFSGGRLTCVVLPLSQKLSGGFMKERVVDVVLEDFESRNIQRNRSHDIGILPVIRVPPCPLPVNNPGYLEGLWIEHDVAWSNVYMREDRGIRAGKHTRQLIFILSTTRGVVTFVDAVQGEPSARQTKRCYSPEVFSMRRSFATIDQVSTHTRFFVVIIQTSLSSTPGMTLIASRPSSPEVCGEDILRSRDISVFFHKSHTGSLRKMDSATSLEDDFVVAIHNLDADLIAQKNNVFMDCAKHAFGSLLVIPCSHYVSPGCCQAGI